MLYDTSSKICGFYQNGLKCSLEFFSELSFQMFKINRIVEENHNWLVIFVYASQDLREISKRTGSF